MPANVLTQRNASDRRGVNRNETLLRPENVRFDQFGKIGGYPVTGSVYAQPLVASGVDCGTAGTKDLVIIATMENRVYAFDATQTGAGARVWPPGNEDGVFLGPSVPSDWFGNRGYTDFYLKPFGILSTPVIELDGAPPCGGVIYLVSAQFDRDAFITNQNTATADMFSHVLVALDLGTGLELKRVVIEGLYPGGGYVRSPVPEVAAGVRFDQAAQAAVAEIDFGNGQGGGKVTVTDAGGLNQADGKNSTAALVQFNSIMQLQRPGLLLQDQSVVIAFGSRGDANPYHGWLFSYDEATFDQTGILCTTPNGGRGGIWQAGQGLIEDSLGNIYACTGNGDNDAVGGSKNTVDPKLLGRNLGESFVSFRLEATGIRLNGWFCFFNDFKQTDPPPESMGEDTDDDFGAGAPALLPDDRVVSGGKDGWLFLIDPDQLDKATVPPGDAGIRLKAVPQAFRASFNLQSGSRVANPSGWETRHIHGSPLVWDGGTVGVFVYVWGENDVVRVYQYAPETDQDSASGRFLNQPENYVFHTRPPQGQPLARGNIYASNEAVGRTAMPGGFLSMSVNGDQSASAILWAAYPPYGDANRNDVAGRLAAYDASNFDGNLAYKRLPLLWHSGQNPGDDISHFAKFCVPTIANGRVYQATGSSNPLTQKCEVAVYGQRTAPVPINLGFNGGGTGLALNGSARVSQNGGVVLTDAPLANAADPTFYAGSFFTWKTLNISRFVTAFTFQLTNADADGFAFVIQAEGPRAIGSAGSGVGYAVDLTSIGDPKTTTAANMQSTILHSFAVKFRLRDDRGNPASLLALMVNGAQLPGFVDMNLLEQNSGPIDLHSSHRITATLRYDGNILFVALQDLTTSVSTQDFALLPGSIAQQINSVQGQAFVGFTGGTGGLSARQEILAWTFRDGVFA